MYCICDCQLYDPIAGTTCTVCDCQLYDPIAGTTCTVYVLASPDDPGKVNPEGFMKQM